jgi:hypothetical protein
MFYGGSDWSGGGGKGEGGNLSSSWLFSVSKKHWYKISLLCIFNNQIYHGTLFKMFSNSGEIRRKIQLLLAGNDILKVFKQRH